jgi:DNA-binding transcriptional MerR regulator
MAKGISQITLDFNLDETPVTSKEEVIESSPGVANDALPGEAEADINAGNSATPLHVENDLNEIISQDLKESETESTAWDAVATESEVPYQEEFPEETVEPVVTKVSFVDADDEVTVEEISPASIPLTSTKKKIASTRGRRALKDFALTSDLIEVPEDEILFQKQYYSIGEVATMFRENQSLIRYWETEFDILKPMKNRKGDRFFRPVDVKNLVLIYDLLRRRKFTIDGAKDFLKKNKKAEEKFALIQSLEKMKSFLLDLKAHL